VWAWDVSPDGHALRRLDPPGTTTNGKPIETGGCLDVAPLTETLPTGRGGLCTPVVSSVIDGRISPDAGWAALTAIDAEHQPNVTLVRTDDLHAGRWTPVPFDVSGPFAVEFWTATGQLVLSESTGNAGRRYVWCAVDGHCAPLAVPDGATLVPHLGP
jgi:hypothetical protein